MVLDIAAEPAPLVQLELVEPDIGNFVGEVAVQAQLGKCLFLLVEHLGQQQAAFEHRDLFLQGLVGLAEDVQLLARLQVPLSQVVEAFGRAQQVAGKASVLLAFGRQQLVGAGLLGLGRELRDGLLGFLAALVVDCRLQGDALLLGTGDLRGQQIAAALPEILQHAVAGQLLPAQFDLGIQGGLFRLEQRAPFVRQRLVVLPTAFQQAVDFVDAKLVLADIGLGALGPGLRADEHAVGRAERLLPEGELVHTGRQALLQYRYRKLGEALG